GLGVLLRQVEGVGHAAAQQHLVRLLLQVVERLAVAGGVDLTVEPVQLGEEALTIGETFFRQSEAQVLLELAAGAGDEGGVEAAEWAGGRDVAPRLPLEDVVADRVRE